MSPAASVPRKQLAVPAPVVQVPPFALTETIVRLAGSVTLTLTFEEASSPLARTVKDVITDVPTIAPTELFGTSMRASGGVYAERHVALFI